MIVGLGPVVVPVVDQALEDAGGHDAASPQHDRALRC